MGKVIAIFNQKGGVGKTTTNINLSACLAKLGKKILVIDNDPQGNSTSGLGVDKNSVDNGLYDALIDELGSDEVIMSTPIDNLDLIPSNVELASAELELVDLDNREKRLKRIIEEIRNDYDYIFIDCPPSLGLLTINSLVASDSILIPIQCEYYALEGVSSLMNTYNLVKNGLNAELEIQGVLLSMYDARTNLSEQVESEVVNYFKDKVYRTIIPKNIRLAEAPSFGQPVIDYAPSSKGAKAYKKLAREFIKFEGDRV